MHPPEGGPKWLATRMRRPRDNTPIVQRQRRKVARMCCSSTARLAMADDDAKGEILSLRWDRLHLGDSPYATSVRNKTGHQRHVPIPEAVIGTSKALPSYGAS